MVEEQEAALLGAEAKRNQLMKALEEHTLIKAALVVDEVGAVKSRIGSARALIRSAAGSTTEITSVNERSIVLKENLYLVGAGDDFLIAIFNDDADFDRIKKDIGAIIADLEI